MITLSISTHGVKKGQGNPEVSLKFLAMTDPDVWARRSGWKLEDAVSGSSTPSGAMFEEEVYRKVVDVAAAFLATEKYEKPVQG